MSVDLIQKSSFVLCIALTAGCRIERTEFKPCELEQDGLAPNESGTGSSPVLGFEFFLLGWNVDSDGSDPGVISRQLVDMDNHDIVCLSNVHADSTELYASAYPEFQSVVSPRDREYQFQVLFRSERFILLECGELYGRNDGCAPPFFVRLLDRATLGDFIVLNAVMHEHDDTRREQLIALQRWAEEQSVGVIALGDFNVSGERDPSGNATAVMELLRDNVWQWVKPFESIDTHWNDPDGDGNDDSPGVMEDLVLVAGQARDWSLESGVVVRECDFPDDDRNSCHRPIELFVCP